MKKVFAFILSVILFVSLGMEVYAGGNKSSKNLRRPVRTSVHGPGTGVAHFTSVMDIDELIALAAFICSKEEDAMRIYEAMEIKETLKELKISGDYTRKDLKLWANRLNKLVK